jgi:uncharacterized alkaline shock family protein YloU
MDEMINQEVEEKEEATVEVPVGEDQEEEGVGNIKIAVEVVSTIAGLATTEIEGVAGMSGTFAGGIAEILGAKKNPSKGVKVEMKETSVVIDLYLIVNYGVRIPELAWEIQENVKNSVETMTGLEVEKVNIHIEGVNFEKEKKKDEPEEEVIVEETTVQPPVEDTNPIV